MKISRKEVQLPKWLSSIARSASNSLPFEASESSYLIANAQNHCEMFVDDFNALPKKRKFELIDIEKLAQLEPVEQNFQLWSDLTEMVFMVRAMTANKVSDLLKSYLRGARAEEILTMANTGRSLLETGVVLADSIKNIIHIPRELAAKPKGALMTFGQDQKDLDALFKAEDEIYKAIFGSRIGTGTLGDKKKTSIWPNATIESRQVVSTNIITAFQGRAKRNRNTEGGLLALDDLRVYEILSDVVHPSGFGYAPYFREISEHDGFHSYVIEKGHRNKEIHKDIASASLFAVSHGLGLFIEVSRMISEYEPGVKAALQDMGC